MSETLETTWDQLQKLLQSRLTDMVAQRGNHRVKVIIQQLPDEDLVLLSEVPEHPAVQASQAVQWTRRLHEWAANHPRLNHEVDDSRDSIYRETVRDSR